MSLHEYLPQDNTYSAMTYKEYVSCNKKDTEEAMEKVKKVVLIEHLD